MRVKGLQKGEEIIDKITKRMIEMLKKEETISSIDMRYGIHGIPSVFDDGTLTETISSVLDDFVEGKVIVPEEKWLAIQEHIKKLSSIIKNRPHLFDIDKQVEWEEKLVEANRELDELMRLLEAN